MQTFRIFWLLLLVSPGLWAQVKFTWKTMPVDSLWNNASNWDGGGIGTFPGSMDSAYVGSCTICPYLTGTVTTVARLNISSGTLNVSDKKMLVTHSLNMTGATLRSNNGALEAVEAPVITLSGFVGPVTLHIRSGNFVQGNHFYSPVTIETGPVAGQRLYIGKFGGDTFHENAILINRSDGGWGAGIHAGLYGLYGATATVFKKKCTFINQNSGGQNVFGSNEYSGNVVFEGPVEIDEQSTSSYAQTSILKAEFQKPLILKSQGGQIDVASGASPDLQTVILKDTVRISGQNAWFHFGKSGSQALFTGTAQLQAGASGLSQCEVKLDKILYQNTTYPLTLDASTYGGSPAQNTVSITANADFEGAVSLKAANIIWTGGTFRKTATLHRSVSINSVNNDGGAVFMDTTHLINQSNRSWTVGNDTYQKNASFTHAGDSTDNRLYLSRTNPDTFSGHLLFSSTATASPAGGIWLGDGLSSSDSVLIPLGKSLQTQSWSRGWLSFKRVFQQDGTPQTLTLTDNSRANFDDCEFNGQVNLTAPHWYIQYARFRGLSSFIKTGTGSDEMLGVNLFYTKTQFINQAPAGNNIRFIHRNDIVR